MNFNVPYLRIIAEKSYSIINYSSELSLTTVNLSEEPTFLEVGDRVTLFQDQSNYYDGLVWSANYTNKEIKVYSPGYSGAPVKLFFRQLYMIRGAGFGQASKIGLTSQENNILGLPTYNSLDIDNIHITSWSVPIALSKYYNNCVGLSIAGFISMISKLKNKTFIVELVDNPGALKHRLLNAVIGSSSFSFEQSGDYFETTAVFLGLQEAGY